MKCKFKKPTGDICGRPSLKNKGFCCLHDPNSISVYFIKDYKNHKSGDILYGISKEEGNIYLKEQVVLKIDRLLLNRIEDSN
jgi:hypothetical protein